MPLTMNKRCSGSDRPRSARLRRRPSTDVTQEGQEKSISEPFEREQSEANKKKAKSKELNLLETSNRLGMKNELFGKQNQKSKPAFLVPTSVEFSDTNFYQRGKEPPKSPRILPKLEKDATRAQFSEESTTTTNYAPDFSIFDEKKALYSGSLTLGNHYSVLPNISHNSSGGAGDISL